MPEDIVPRDQWQDFFTYLSNQYTGKLVTVESVARGEGTLLVALDEPFGVTSLDMQNGVPIIRVGFGISAIVIQSPLRVQTEPFADGGGQIIQIESATAPMMRLYLSHHAQRGARGGLVRELGAGDVAVPWHGSANQHETHNGTFDTQE